jgi:hypothetical protein
MFERKKTVLPSTNIIVGELDYTVPGCYRNVEVLPFDVKPKHTITLSVRSDIPVDVAIANDDGSTAKFKQAQTDIVIGPIDTGKNTSMAVMLGVYPGDKADVTVEAWMERI